MIKEDGTRLNFPEALENLINTYSIENESNTPDFILAEYLRSCLDAFNEANRKRENWYGKYMKPGQ
jgi:hypothetical protein